LKIQNWHIFIISVTRIYLAEAYSENQEQKM